MSAESERNKEPLEQTVQNVKSFLETQVQEQEQKRKFSIFVDEVTYERLLEIHQKMISRGYVDQNVEPAQVIRAAVLIGIQEMYVTWIQQGLPKAEGKYGNG